MGKLHDQKSMEILDYVDNSMKFFTDCMYEGSELKDDKFQMIMSEQMINPTRQEIMRHLKVYEIPLSIIRDSIYVLEELQKGNEDHLFQ